MGLAPLDQSQGREQRHSLIQSALGEHPLCARHGAGPWEQSSDQHGSRRLGWS